MADVKKRHHGADINTTASKKNKLDRDNLKPSQTLYIKNLNDQINHKTLKHNLYLMFSTYGDIVDIKLNMKNKRMRGQAHLIYDNVTSASTAKKFLDKESFFDKPLEVNYSDKQSKIITRIEESYQEGKES